MTIADILKDYIKANNFDGFKATVLEGRSTCKCTTENLFHECEWFQSDEIMVYCEPFRIDKKDVQA